MGLGSIIFLYYAMIAVVIKARNYVGIDDDETNSSQVNGEGDGPCRPRNHKPGC
jgi:hypothetical protein